MLKKNLFSLLLSLCDKHRVTYRNFSDGDIVIDHESNHNLYVFESGWYTVWVVSPFGGLHEIGEINAPSILGEGVFFGSFQKPVKVITKSPGKVYILSEKIISDIASEHQNFREILMRACLSVTNDRIKEANMERTLGYALIDALENHSFTNIPTLLKTLKNIFTLDDVVWIERHQVLHDVFSIRFRESSGNFMINERLRHPLEISGDYGVEKGLFGTGYAHIFPIKSRGECYGYIVYTLSDEHLPGYIRRITFDMIPNYIRLIEAGWKR